MAQTPYNQALDLLAARSYSAKELRRKLVQKAVAPEEADRVIAQLRESGLVDDAKYALAFARSKLLGSGASERRIRQELARNGVEGGLVGKAIEKVVADEEIDTRAVIERVARKKLATMGDLEPLVLRRRLYGFLVRKGYDMDEVQAVIQQLVTRSS